jgi:hypothetical protein
MDISEQFFGAQNKKMTQKKSRWGGKRRNHRFLVLFTMRVRVSQVSVRKQSQILLDDVSISFPEKKRVSAQLL